MDEAFAEDDTTDAAMAAGRRSKRQTRSMP